MSEWIEIKKDSDIEDKSVLLMVGEHPSDNIYSGYYDEDKNMWLFYDRNDVESRDWIGEPTHYKLVNG